MVMDARVIGYGNCLKDKLVDLELFIEELSRYTYGHNGTLHFAAARVALDPLFPIDLFAYIVCTFDQQGGIVYPDGSEQRPIFFAVNRQRSGAEQVTTFLSLVLSALSRQPMLSSAMSGESKLDSGFSMRIDEIDRAMRDEAERLLRASQAAGSIEPITQRLESFGLDIKFEYRQAVRSNLSEIRAVMRFAREAYNELDIVRDAVDKMAAMVVSTGPRLVGTGSEAIRVFGERRLTGMGVPNLIAQWFRDAELFGTSGLVFDYKVDVAGRLIRPDKMRVEGHGLAQRVFDELLSESWPLFESSEPPDATIVLQRGVEQDGSPYGLSILEPSLATIHKLLTSERVTKDIITLTATHNRPDREAGRILLVADEARRSAEAALERLFWFPNTQLNVKQTELYFPGWELWNP